jgi:hypothetical protein
VDCPQPLPEGAPEPSGLGEAVQQHHGRTRAARLDVEWHVR